MLTVASFNRNASGTWKGRPPNNPIGRSPLSLSAKYTHQMPRRSICLSANLCDRSDSSPPPCSYSHHEYECCTAVAATDREADPTLQEHAATEQPPRTAVCITSDQQVQHEQLQINSKEMNNSKEMISTE